MEVKKLCHLDLWGDKNTKNIHSATNQRRENTIWELKDVNGTNVFSQKDLQNEVVRIFGNLHWAKEVVDMDNQLEIIHTYP